MNNKFAVKTWHDHHRVPTLFFVIDEDDCELGRFPSEAEAVSNAAALEEGSRFLQELATAASDAEIADIFARYKDFRESLPPHQRERLVAEAQDIIAGNTRRIAASRVQPLTQCTRHRGPRPCNRSHIPEVQSKLCDSRESTPSATD